MHTHRIDLYTVFTSITAEVTVIKFSDKLRVIPYFTFFKGKVIKLLSSIRLIKLN